MIGSMLKWACVSLIGISVAAAATTEPTTRPGQADATTQPATRPVAFDVYGGYFVSNQFEPNAPLSIVVARDRAAFDAVFGAGYVMGDRSHRLANNVFDNNIVLAVIRRGVFWNYSMTGATESGGVLTLSYSAKSDPPGTATFSSSLIVSVPRGDYREIRFEENGKVISTQSLK